MKGHRGNSGRFPSGASARLVARGNIPLGVAGFRHDVVPSAKRFRREVEPASGIDPTPPRRGRQDPGAGPPPDARKRCPGRVQPAPEAGSARVFLKRFQQFRLLPPELGLALPRRPQARGLGAGDVVERALGALAGAGLDLGLQAQAFGLFGLDAGLDAQALGLGAGARGILPTGLDQQFAALAVQAVDLPPGQLRGRGDLGGLDAPLGDLAGIGL